MRGVTWRSWRCRHRDIEIPGADVSLGRCEPELRPAILDSLFAPVTALPGIGPQLARLFERLAGPLVVDLLWHLPSGIVDRRAAPSIRDLEAGQIVTIQVRVEAHEAGRGRRPYRVFCADDTGTVTLVYFNVKSDYLARLFPIGAERIVSGRVEFYNGMAQIPHPDLVLRPDELDRLKPIEPVYPLTAGLFPRVVQRAAAAALERAPDLPEWIDPSAQGTARLARLGRRSAPSPFARSRGRAVAVEPGARAARL